MTMKPLRCSLVSANGPSRGRQPLLRTRTVTAPLAGACKRVRSRRSCRSHAARRHCRACRSTERALSSARSSARNRPRRDRPGRRYLHRVSSIPDIVNRAHLDAAEFRHAVFPTPAASLRPCRVASIRMKPPRCSLVSANGPSLRRHPVVAHPHRHRAGRPTAARWTRGSGRRDAVRRHGSRLSRSNARFCSPRTSARMWGSV